MLRFVNRYFVHIDDRGSIQGLIHDGMWRELNLITSDADNIRGDHYHKKTQELFIILEGEIEVRTQRVVDNKLHGTVSINTVKNGDVFLVESMTNHIFIPKTFSKWINVLSEPMDQLNPDMHRVMPGNV